MNAYKFTFLTLVVLVIFYLKYLLIVQNIIKPNKKTKTTQQSAKVVTYEIEDPLNGFGNSDSPWWESTSEACNRSPFNYDYEFESTHNNTGHCGARAFKAGDRQKVISYTFYGTDESYLLKLTLLLDNVRRMYPGWLVRLHTDPRPHQHLLCPVLQQFDNFFICDMNSDQNREKLRINPLLWRMIPLGDPQVRVFLVRDLESMVRIYPSLLYYFLQFTFTFVVVYKLIEDEISQIIDREVAAVQEWVNSSTLLHVMRDHPSHNFIIPGTNFGIYQPESAHELIAAVSSNVFKVSSSNPKYYLKALEASLKT